MSVAVRRHPIREKADRPVSTDFDRTEEKNESLEGRNLKRKRAESQHKTVIVRKWPLVFNAQTRSSNLELPEITPSGYEILAFLVSVEHDADG